MRLVRVKTKSKKGGYYDYYRCNNVIRRVSLPGCARNVRVHKIDEEIWRKVWKLVSEPSEFERALEGHIATLKTQEIDAEGEYKRLEQELEGLMFERQKVVTWARKDFITEADLQTQLFTLTEQEKAIKRNLNDARLMMGNQAERLLQLAALYRERVKLGYEAVNLVPDTPEEKEAQFQARCRIIEGLVTRANVLKNKGVTVNAEIHFKDIEVVEDVPFFTSEILTPRSISVMYKLNVSL